MTVHQGRYDYENGPEAQVWKQHEQKHKTVLNKKTKWEATACATLFEMYLHEMAAQELIVQALRCHPRAVDSALWGQSAGRTGMYKPGGVRTDRTNTQLTVRDMFVIRTWLAGIDKRKKLIIVDDKYPDADVVELPEEYQSAVRQRRRYPLIIKNDEQSSVSYLGDYALYYLGCVLARDPKSLLDTIIQQQHLGYALKRRSLIEEFLRHHSGKKSTKKPASKSSTGDFDKLVVELTRLLGVAHGSFKIKVVW